MTDKQRIVVEQALIGEHYSLSGPVEIVLSEGRIEAINPTNTPPGQSPIGYAGSCRCT